MAIWFQFYLFISVLIVFYFFFFFLLLFLYCTSFLVFIRFLHSLFLGFITSNIVLIFLLLHFICSKFMNFLTHLAMSHLNFPDCSTCLLLKCCANFDRGLFCHAHPILTHLAVRLVSIGRPVRVCFFCCAVFVARSQGRFPFGVCCIS